MSRSRSSWPTRRAPARASARVDGLAVGAVAEVEHDAGREEPLQRQLVDRLRGPAARSSSCSGRARRRGSSCGCRGVTSRASSPRRRGAAGPGRRTSPRSRPRRRRGRSTRPRCAGIPAPRGWRDRRGQVDEARHARDRVDARLPDVLERRALEPRTSCTRRTYSRGHFLDPDARQRPGTRSPRPRRPASDGEPEAAEVGASRCQTVAHHSIGSAAHSLWPARSSLRRGTSGPGPRSTSAQPPRRGRSRFPVRASTSCALTRGDRGASRSHRRRRYSRYAHTADAQPCPRPAVRGRRCAPRSEPDGARLHV